MRRDARVLLAGALALGGCATTALQYGRDGLAPVDHAVRASLAAGQYGSAYETALGKDARLRDRLLRALSVGTLGLYANRTDSSVWALDRAFALAEDRWSKRLSNAAASALVNDYVLPYTPGPTERLFIPFYGALSWLSRGDRDDAAVEARRLVQLLGEAPADSSRSSTTELRGIMHYVAGAVFDAAGESGAAAVAYRNAARLVTVPVSRDSTVPDSLAGDVVVVLERGFVGHPVPREQTIWLTNDELRAMRHDGAGGGWTAARGVQMREGLRWFGPFGSRRGLEVGVSINWPEFREGRDVMPSLTLSAPGVRQVMDGAGNVSRAVRADFERDQSARFARALVRAAARGAIYKAASDRLSRLGDEDRHARRPRPANEGPPAERPVGVRDDAKTAKDKGHKGRDAAIAGTVLAGIGFFALAASAEVNDRPDVRSWNLLPHDLRVVRLRLLAGEQDVRAIVDGQEVIVGHANVRPGGVTVIAHRFFSALSSSTIAAAGQLTAADTIEASELESRRARTKIVIELDAGEPNCVGGDPATASTFRAAPCLLPSRVETLRSSRPTWLPEKRSLFRKSR